MIRYQTLVLAMLICLAASAVAGLNKDTMNDAKDEFNTVCRPVRPEFLAYSTYSLKVDDLDHACQVPPVLRRLGAAGEVFRIRKVHTKRDYFMVELETPGKTRLKIRAYDRAKLTQEFLDKGLARLLNDIFEFGPPPPPVWFVGHTESRLLHLSRCNHLPPLDRRQEFAGRDTGLAAGFRECPICFGNVESLPYPDYLSHRTAGLQDARAFELVYPVSPDTVLQTRLDLLGAEVLAHWPLELAGFDYDFQVVVADQPLAASFRTGIVVVSDTMLEAADADEEILFVLAHEIAHCELHLEPRSPFAGKNYWSPMSKG